MCVCLLSPSRKIADRIDGRPWGPAKKAFRAADDAGRDLQPFRRACELERIEERIKPGLKRWGNGSKPLKRNGRHEETRTPDLYRVNFEVSNPKPFPYLAFPRMIDPKRAPKQASFDGELMASFVSRPPKSSSTRQCGPHCDGGNRSASKAAACACFRQRYTMEPRLSVAGSAF